VTTTDPAVLLSHLNRLLCASTAAASTATAIVARYDPPTRTLVWAQAGHPPPLHVRAGHTTELPRPRGPLLGAVVNAPYETATMTIELGDLLLFYTDGLVEHRDHSMQEGLAPVVATLNRISAARGPQPLAALLAELRRANPDDDTCVLAARPLPGAPEGGS
jgi:serine phosphatase RsbU (regulator of sigma subunit)